MAKKKIKHYKSTPAVRTDMLDLNPSVGYEDLAWKTTGDPADYQGWDDRYKYDPIAHKIVAKFAEDATRNGFRLVMPGKPDLQDVYQNRLNELKIQNVLAQQTNFQRRHGDGYIAYIVRELHPTSTFDPLKTDNIDNLVALHAFGQKNVESYQTNEDPTSDDYGKESKLKIMPKQTGVTYDKNGDIVPNNNKLEPIVLDSTRYSHISLDKFDEDTNGTSIIKRCERQLNNMAIASVSAGKMLREFTLKVFQSDRLMNEPLDKFQQDKAEISRVANTEAMMFTGNDDKVLKLGTPVAGMNVLLDYLWQDLSTACNIPKSVLTGEQAGTLAGASQDVQNYYDSVKAFQEQVLKPEIMNIVRLLMYSQSFGGGYLDPDSLEWHIEFNPLWTPDDKTQSEVLLNHANAAGTLVTNGIYAPDEVRSMFDQQGNNAIQGMQNNSNPVTDSADNPEDRYTKEEIEQYKRDIERAGLE